jgi:hypothetical protein
LGLLIFSIGSHKRGDLVYPLIAPSALLGARVLARLFEGDFDAPVDRRRTVVGAFFRLGSMS